MVIREDAFYGWLVNLGNMMFRRKKNKLKVGDIVAIDSCYEPVIAVVKAVDYGRPYGLNKALVLTEEGKLKTVLINETIVIQKQDYIRLLKQRAMINKEEE